MLIADEILAGDEVGGIEGDNKLIEKYGKLSKTRKLSKSQKLAKSKKESSKNGNLPNFDAKKNKPIFFTPNARTTFKHLRLACTKAPILQYFDLEYYIRIKTDASGYAIGGMLSQLTFETRPDGIVTKT